MGRMNTRPVSWPARVVALLLGLCGAVLAFGGAWLAVRGGSAYYLLAGAAWLGCGWLMWRGRVAGLWVFAIAFAATLAWALWECGVDWWPLAARLDVPFVLGLLVLLASRQFDGVGGRSARWSIAGVLALFAVVAVASWVHDPHDVDGRLADGTSAAAPGGMAAADWTAYGGSGLGQRYSALRQIDPRNGARLEQAGHFHTGDVRGRPGDPVETTFEATPLKIGQRLFFCTPHQDVIALDATSGTELWRFHADVPQAMALQHLTCRGLAFAAATGTAAAPQPAASAPVAASARPPADASCAAMLFMPTADGRLIALNPDTGHVCASFGGGAGQVNLWAGMPNFRPGAYYATSPPVVARGLVIVGGTVLDNVSTHEQSGVIRAYDLAGRLVWNWDSGNPAQTAPLGPGQTYTVNSPSSWSISAVDESLGLV
jgi:quinoprotein glucose dehydrogenase